MSPDKDLCHVLQGTRVVCYDRRKGAFFDEEGVWGASGSPRVHPDYLALVGNSADGLPGCGLGSQVVGRRVARYGHLEAIPLRGRAVGA